MAIRYSANEVVTDVRRVVTEIQRAVTKPVTKPRNETPDVTKPRGGRPPAGAVAMSGAERVRKHRQGGRADGLR
jgi:hypothetical protein